MIFPEPSSGNIALSLCGSFAEKDSPSLDSVVLCAHGGGSHPNVSPVGLLGVEASVAKPQVVCNHPGAADTQIRLGLALSPRQIMIVTGYSMLTWRPFSPIGPTDRRIGRSIPKCVALAGPRTPKCQVSVSGASAVDSEVNWAGVISVAEAAHGDWRNAAQQRAARAVSRTCSDSGAVGLGSHDSTRRPPQTRARRRLTGSLWRPFVFRLAIPSGTGAEALRGLSHAPLLSRRPRPGLVSTTNASTTPVERMVP